jgi:hypothetical protein
MDHPEVTAEFIFDQLGAVELAAAYQILVLRELLDRTLTWTQRHLTTVLREYEGLRPPRRGHERSRLAAIPGVAGICHHARLLPTSRLLWILWPSLSESSVDSQMDFSALEQFGIVPPASYLQWAAPQNKSEESSEDGDGTR